MKSLLGSILIVAALAPAAAAGTYIGVGVGTGASTDGGMAVFGSDGHHSGRLVLGDRFGLFSIEGGVGYIGLEHAANQWNAMSLGLAGKLNLPITPVFDGYVRLGLESTSVQLEHSDGTHDLGASGWTGGLGLEYRFDSFSIWADYAKHTLSFDTPAYDGAASVLTVGVNVGI